MYFEDNKYFKRYYSLSLLDIPNYYKLISIPRETTLIDNLTATTSLIITYSDVNIVLKI